MTGSELALHRGPDLGPQPKKSIKCSEVDHTDKSTQLRESASRLKDLAKSLRKEGQLEPIKVYPGEKGYLIIDGHTRFAAAQELGWETVDVIIYHVMSLKEARRLAFTLNVVRKNLSVADRAGVFLAARKEGVPVSTIAEIHGVSTRTVSRYVNLPDPVTKAFDGNHVSYAHCRLLTKACCSVAEEEFEELVRRIRDEGLTANDLKKTLRGMKVIAPVRSGRKKRFGSITATGIRLYDHEVSKGLSKVELEECELFLREALDQVQEYLAAINQE